MAGENWTHCLGGICCWQVGKWGMGIQVHECRWSAGQRQVQMERWAPAAAPNHTAFTSFIADLAAAEAPSRIPDLHRPSSDFWPLVDVDRREEERGGEGMRRVGKGGSRSKRREGRCQKPKGLPR